MDDVKRTGKTPRPVVEKPCKTYSRGDCALDHCYKCGRHLNADGECPKGCKDGDA